MRCGGKVLSDGDESVGFLDEHALATDLDYPSLLPAAQGAADGVERRACHLGQVLSRQSQVDEHSSLHFMATRVGETQEGVRNPTFDAFGRQLEVPLLHFLDTLCEVLHGVESHARVCFHHPRECLCIPCEDCTFLRRLRGHRIGRLAENGNPTEHFARMNELQEDLVACGRETGEFHLSFCEDIEEVCRVILPEKVCRLWNLSSSCQSEDFCEVGRPEIAK